MFLCSLAIKIMVQQVDIIMVDYFKFSQVVFLILLSEDWCICKFDSSFLKVVFVNLCIYWDIWGVGVCGWGCVSVSEHLVKNAESLTIL